MIAACALTLALAIALTTFHFLATVDHMIFKETQRWDSLDAESLRSQDPFRIQTNTFRDDVNSSSEENEVQNEPATNLLPGRSDYQRGGSPLFCELLTDLQRDLPRIQVSPMAVQCKN